MTADTHARPTDDAILARHLSRCPACDRRIERGDLIAYVAGQWIHDDCDRAGGPR